jgi:hypothetical protein
MLIGSEVAGNIISSGGGTIAASAAVPTTWRLIGIPSAAASAVAATATANRQR